MENLLLTVLIICIFLLTWHLGALSIVYPFQADSWCLLEYSWVVSILDGVGLLHSNWAQKCVWMPVRIAVAAQEVVVGDGRSRFDVPAAACVRHHADRPASRIGRRGPP